MDVDTIGAAENQRIYEGVKPIDDNVLNEQQRIADTFFQLKLIPKKINARTQELAWKPDKSWL